MSALFPSQAWVEALVRVLNDDSRYGEIARNWEGDLLFVIKADGGASEASETRPTHVYLDLWHGKCRSGRYLPPGGRGSAQTGLYPDRRLHPLRRRPGRKPGSDAGHAHPPAAGFGEHGLHPSERPRRPGLRPLLPVGGWRRKSSCGKTVTAVQPRSPDRPTDLLPLSAMCLLILASQSAERG